ncbi:Stp1/IreP family PP2C-type Ser/Thr phosphatase [Numidum massiliense]|uniref:Stp1/IreP family PP2C-type Ser/Thr phosphatase n=1 Tax=Numidum massiliense TaxID=1522315 RepID=UPI0006D59B7E|nr:Stp1/IreP family PP2C-type Ser/Thr phosphatase [Numidum massiliense]
MEWAYRSDIGRVRSHNEDSITVQALDAERGFVVVADGMGGHKAGDVASCLAAEVVSEKLQAVDARSLTPVQLKDEIVGGMQRANELVLKKSQEDESMRGMGTTLVVAVVRAENIVIGNIGDSRAYLISEGTYRQLTQDHSLVNELLNAGEITEVEARDHPQKNMIMRAVGTDRDVEPDVTEHVWATGDYLLVCTDGLTDMVSDEQIHATIQRDETIDWKADELMRLALEAGGTDNISLALVKRTAVSAPDEKAR